MSLPTNKAMRAEIKEDFLFCFLMHEPTHVHTHMRVYTIVTDAAPSKIWKKAWHSQ